MMMFLMNFFTCFMITLVATACISGQETQIETSTPGPNSNVPYVHISVGNSDCRTCSSYQKNVSYLYGPQKVTWFQAYVLCKQVGMELASVSSQQEEMALETYLKQFTIQVGLAEGFWLAGTRHGSCASDFVWFTTGKPVIYRIFDSGQPDNFKENEACLHLFLNSPDVFAWNDLPCDSKLGYICQSTGCSET